MDEETLRRLAIWRFEQGERPAEIWPRLGRSRRWFFKWLARYRAEGAAALAGRSRAHRGHPRATTAPIRAAVHALRDDHPHWGERTIARELPARVLGPLPAHATVGRILRAAGRTDRPRAHPPTARYPRLVPEAALDLVEHDFFGPRWILGFGRVVCYQSMDIWSRSVYLGAQRDKAATTQLGYWLGLFQRFGLPQVVQTDNEFGLSGALRHGVPFTRLTRLFLRLGIEHRFIPAGEPYRNGHIERFNRTFREDFYDQHLFRDLDHLRAREAQYARYFNEQRPHGGIRYAVPASRFPAARTHLADEVTVAQFDLDHRRLAPGRVTYVRRVGSDGDINILNDQPVQLDPSLAGEYVTALVQTPDLDLTVLTVDGEIVPAIRATSAR